MTIKKVKSIKSKVTKKTEQEELEAAAEIIHKNIKSRIDNAAAEYNIAVESIQKKYGVQIGISTPQVIIKPN